MENETVVNTRLMLPTELHSKLLIAKANSRTDGKAKTIHDIIIDILDNGLFTEDDLTENKRGVYFLFIGQELTYIGSSKNIKQRIAQQRIRFDRAFFVPFDGDIIELEYFLISVFAPNKNKNGKDLSKRVTVMPHRISQTDKNSFDAAFGALQSTVLREREIKITKEDFLSALIKFSDKVSWKEIKDVLEVNA